MSFYLSFITYNRMFLTKIFFLCIRNGRFYCSIFDSSRRYSTQMTSTQEEENGVVMNRLQVNCGVVSKRLYAVKFQDVGKPARKTQICSIPHQVVISRVEGCMEKWGVLRFLDYELFIIILITRSITTDNPESL